MKNKKVLILGSRSYASQGLVSVLTSSGYDVTCFDRGEVNYNAKNVSGPVLAIHENPFLAKNYDTVINYIILKDQNVETNLDYIKSVLRLCKNRRIKRLIQISSLSVYSFESKVINEQSPIDEHLEYRGEYSRIKVAVDKYLESVSDIDLQISFVRPGFVISEGTKSSLAGI